MATMIERIAAAEEQAAADGEWTSASGSDWGADAEKLRVYSCPSCGAELICDEATSATSCPYCGNHRARAVQRRAQARLCAALQAG